MPFIILKGSVLDAKLVKLFQRQPSVKGIVHSGRRILLNAVCWRTSGIQRKGCSGIYEDPETIRKDKERKGGSQSND